MLNRRSLRIKAMQNLYAFKQSKESDYHIAVDLIKQTFAPDLNSMEFQDKELLSSQKKQAMALFSEHYQMDNILIDNTVGEDVQKAAEDALVYYKKQVKKDLDFFKKQMVSEVEEIFDNYLTLLLLLVEWAEVAQEESEKRVFNKANAAPIGLLNLMNNKVIVRLGNSKPLKIEVIKRNLDWAEERDEVRQWFKEILKKDEKYQEYIKIENPVFEEDKQIVLHIVKNLIFKQDSLQGFWEERDMNWSENKTILKSMVVKTIKAISEEGLDSEPQLIELSSNWEDDKDFFVQLFALCVKHNYQYEALVAKKAKNWDVERIASTDKILLEMALCEMINFPSIPIKVTINEYIDISKLYSTPKSKQFVNGILDVLAEELQEEGVIKKSGRGLIDNK